MKIKNQNILYFILLTKELEEANDILELENERKKNISLNQMLNQMKKQNDTYQLLIEKKQEEIEEINLISNNYKLQITNLQQNESAVIKVLFYLLYLIIKLLIIKISTNFKLIIWNIEFMNKNK